MTKILTLALATLLLVTTEASATRPTKGRPLKTGQTTSYGTGSDGDLQKGLSRMYNDLGNGVIKDQRTGLFWEKKSDDGSIHDKDFTYSWSADGDSFNGTTASVFLATLNSPPCFAGYCDWRLPNSFELYTIVDLGRKEPATDPIFDRYCAPGCSAKPVIPGIGTGCSCTVSGYYWSSSTYQYFPDYAWFVYFPFGGVAGDFKTSGHYVRAVRGGS
ncbi:MAG: hypothetical protein RL698_3359 [Pseudomonadota bacterium]|jgi:hypothetical protein